MAKKSKIVKQEHRRDTVDGRPRGYVGKAGRTADSRLAFDYKDTETLRCFLSDRGRIRRRAVSGLSPQQQRQLATAVRNAREMALLPF